MGREGEWTAAPPRPGGVLPPQSSAGFPGVPTQNSAPAHPPGMIQGTPGPWGPPSRNVGMPQGVPGNPPLGQHGQSMQPGPVPGSLPAGPPARAPFPGGPPGGPPPGVRPPFLSSSNAPVAGPGQSPMGSGYGPPQQPGMFANNAMRGPPTGPPGVSPGPGGAPGVGTTQPPSNLNFPGRPGPQQMSNPAGSQPQRPSSQPQPASMGPPQQRPQGSPFAGAPGQGPPTAAYSATAGVSRPAGQPVGPFPPNSASVPPYGPPQPPTAQFQNLSFQNQNQGTGGGGPPTNFAPPMQGGVQTSAPPSWGHGPPRRVYPEFGGPPTGPPQSQPGPPQSFSQTPSHLPPNMGHIPGVSDKYGSTIAGMSQPGSPAASAAAPPSGTSRIDPNQIPRPQPNASHVVFATRVNGQANLPPSATSVFVVKDTGNCSPRLMRCTLNQIPCSGDLLNTSGMPLAIMVQPFALPHPSEEPIQIVDFGESGPVRCSRCKGYINPFMKFIDQGRRFTCNLCGFTNETPRDYHCNLGPDGRRRDADQRPELSRGTVEFVASPEYLVRPPMPAVFFFLIDVSMNAVQTGAVAAACSAINRALSDLPEGSNTLVGIATFDSTIHYYSLNKKLQQPAMLVVPDIQDPYTPLQTDLIVPLSEGRDHLEQILEGIPSMFQNNRIPESAFGAAVKGAYLAMKSTGGKLMVFQSVLPSIGLGALTPRESEGRVSGEKEALKLLQPADKLLKTMAIELAEFQVCVDLFLTAQMYVDIASLSVVPRTTGGQVYFYQPFYAGADSAKLYNDLRWNVTRPQGLEAVMRVRCSQGLQVQEYYGNFCKRIPTDVDLPAIDSDKTIMVTFKHDDKFQDGSECCFQCALLYTTVTGQRRIRVITLSLSCTSVLSNLFRGADLDAQFTYFLKTSAQEIPNVPLTQVRDQMTAQCVNILYTYRKFCATASSSGQLILPEALKLLPLYTLALTKSIGLRADTRVDTRVDDRAYWFTRVASLAAPLSIPLVYPRMFAIHTLPPRESLAEGELPPVVPLSSENLDHDGVFLLETGEDAFLYVGKQASVELLEQLFGVHSVDEVVPGQFMLQEFDNPASKRLNEIVNEIRRQRCSYMRLRLLRRGDPLEFLFFAFLVEDKSSSGLSYVEFLVHVHRQIQNKMT
ncbi:protein transport protein SEC24 [Marchantia polymorpha subsp. ruderalis]|uniref:Protein transport protein Sec24-like CEF n=2 Tax=Marchantia polymorpha TaxID=3197 RepID=A0AAF6BZ51_MARPO|nr:hypothetical protein MARPO_0009s0021 [Marchantia polymorpha]BBN17285.1 hypothetical protein Mp_7g13350 [Marchantia polymorpha subsp. ruderalis]|eukprot:PTQ46890.1 hypothetical protein MARPO_0009s0021 [Marchantia polymorpha]